MYPAEKRVMNKLRHAHKTNSRQDKIIALLMNNRDYNIRVQNMMQSDRLNSLVDNEYFLTIYYNSLYQKIDRLLAKIDHEDRYSTENDDSEENEEQEGEFTEDEDFVFSDDEDSPIKKGFKGLGKSIMKGLERFKKGPTLIRKNLLQRSLNSSGLTASTSKFGKIPSASPLIKFNPEDEQRFYQEQKALLTEEIDGFDAEEFESELPRRISEAVKVLNDRMKGLKRDEFGDPIIEEGFLEEPQGKNLQLSALRLTNLMSQMFKKNPLPEFRKQIEAMYKNFRLDTAIDSNADIKSKIMSGKGVTGILGMMQKNMQKQQQQSAALAKGYSEGYPPGFNPARRLSSFQKADKMLKQTNIALTEMIKQGSLTKEEILKIQEQMKNGNFEYLICTNCFLKSKESLHKETQTCSTDISDFDQEKEGEKLKNQDTISIIDSEGKDVTMKHMPTHNPFASSNLAGPSLTKKFDAKPQKGSGSNLQKVKTTKMQAFNFAHGPSATMNFNQYEVFTPSGRSPINFRLFNLSKSGFTSSAKGFKLPNYVFIFVQKFREGHKSVKSVNPLPMKMMFKQINQFYNDKANQAKDSVNIRNATMLEFVYEYLQNKYGKTPILERKVKEILFTTLKNENKFKKITLFAKFLGISNSLISYTNDDLSMYYSLNRIVGSSFDQIKLFFSGKMSQETLGVLMTELNDIVNTLEDSSKKLEIEEVFFKCIKTYQNCKCKIVNYLIDNNLISVDQEDDVSSLSDDPGVIAEKDELMEESFNEENKQEFLQPSPKKGSKKLDIEGLMLDMVYSCEEFKSIFNSISNSIQFTSDSLEVIFDKYGLFKGEEKKITLESMAAIIFKYEILPL